MSQSRIRLGIVPFAALLVGIFTGIGIAQVPSHQERIRKTAGEILSRPEFGLFPRLGSTAESELRKDRIMPRLQSPGGRNAGGGNAGENRGQAHQARRVGPNGLPPDAPGAPPKADRGHLEDARKALGQDEIIPEGNNLKRLLDDENLVPDNGGGREPRADENDQGDQNQNRRANEGQNPPANPGRDNNPNAEPPQPAEPPRPENADAAGENRRQPIERIGNRQSVLPAPRPRQTSAEPARERPAGEVGSFARMVGAVFHVMAWTILAVICGLILWLIVKAIYEFERPRKLPAFGSASAAALDLSPSQAPGDLPADVYLARARRLAEGGRYREAVVQLMMGAMSRMERAGWVRFRQGMTVRDYLRTIHEHPSAQAGFRTIVRVFEPLGFGRREPTEEHFDKSLKGYETGFGID